MNAAIYCRKSNEQTGVDDDAKSVARQEEHARQYANKKGWTVERVFTDDGISGAEFAKRPGFVSLMSALKPKPRFNVLIMSEESRLGREMIETSYALKQIVMSGVRVFYYMEDRERTLDSPTDKIMMSVNAYAAEVEREMARHRSRDAARQRAQHGAVAGGRCFGYDNVCSECDRVIPAGTTRCCRQGRTLRRRNDAEAAVVLRIFQMYDSGTGLKRTAKQLTAEGAVAPKPFIRRDATKVLPVGGWSPSTVGAVLQRELYRGVVVWNRSEKRPTANWGQICQTARPESEWIRLPVNKDLRIVPDDLWNRVAKRRADVEGKAARFSSGRLCGGTPKHESRNLLAGLATCALCGGGLYVETAPRKRGRVPEYVCGRRRINGTCANSLRMPVAEVNEAVLQTVERHALTEEAIEQVIHFSERDDVTDMQTKIEQEQKDVARRLKKLTGLIEDDAGDVAVLVARVRELETRQRELLTEATRLRPIPRLAPAVIENRLAEWRRLLRQSTTTGRTVLQRILRGRLTFTLRRNEISGEIDGYEFEATTRFDQLFSGIAVERPANLDPRDLTGIEGIGPDDTGEADFGRLLDRVYEKSYAGGLASPAGFEPAF